MDKDRARRFGVPPTDTAPLTPAERAIVEVLARAIVRDLLEHPEPVAVDDDVDDEPDDAS